MVVLLQLLARPLFLQSVWRLHVDWLRTQHGHIVTSVKSQSSLDTLHSFEQFLNEAGVLKDEVLEAVTHFSLQCAPDTTVFRNCIREQAW